jgi:hypothetical protein
VSDAGLQFLAGFRSLQVLHLNSTNVKGKRLKALAGLKRLLDLSLAYTKVTGASVAALEKALPTCRISR